MNHSSDMHEPSTKNMSRRFSCMKCEQPNDAEGGTPIKSKTVLNERHRALLIGFAIGFAWTLIIILLLLFLGFTNLR